MGNRGAVYPELALRDQQQLPGQWSERGELAGWGVGPHRTETHTVQTAGLPPATTGRGVDLVSKDPDKCARKPGFIRDAWPSSRGINAGA